MLSQAKTLRDDIKNLTKGQGLLNEDPFQVDLDHIRDVGRNVDNEPRVDNNSETVIVCITNRSDANSLSTLDKLCKLIEGEDPDSQHGTGSEKTTSCPMCLLSGVNNVTGLCKCVGKKDHDTQCANRDEELGPSQRFRTSGNVAKTPNTKEHGRKTRQEKTCVTMIVLALGVLNFRENLRQIPMNCEKGFFIEAKRDKRDINDAFQRVSIILSQTLLSNPGIRIETL